MGSAPTQQFKADLNGTGTLVDITAYVAEDRYQHRYGRSDWTSAVQPAGTLTVTLESLDGRFTPGSTAVYARGVVRNMTVEWNCGGRLRRFYVATATPSFPTGVSGKWVVTLVCRDALGLLAERKMAALVREETLAGNPVAYWPCDESVAADVEFSDISGNAQPSLRPFTKETGAANVWGVEAGYVDSGGRGPRTDGAGAPILNRQATTPILIGQAVSPFGHRGALRNVVADGDAPVQGLNRQITIPDKPAYVWTGGGTPPTETTFPTSGWLNATGSAMEYVVSFWFSINDIYGGTSTTAALTDGPYVSLLEIPLRGSDAGSWVIMWRIPDRRIVVAGPNEIKPLSTDSYSVSPGDVHHLVVTLKHKEKTWTGAFYSFLSADIRGCLDGRQLTNNAINLGPVQYPTGVTAGGHTNSIPATSGTDRSIYALSGGVSNISIHGPDQVGVTGIWAQAGNVWDTGTTGPLESSLYRAERVLRLAQRLLPAPIVYGPDGLPQPGLLGPHDTAGKDALTVLCETLAAEEAMISTGVDAGNDSVTPHFDSTQRQIGPAVTIDAQDDGSGAPQWGFDLSGVVATAEAKAANQAVSWTDTAAAVQWAGSSASMATALISPVDLLALAQWRTVKGRSGRVSPTRVTVNLAASKADLTTSMLTLWPGATVRLSGLPASKVGYSSIDCTLVGVTESHSTGRNMVELTLIPRVAEGRFDPGLGTEGPWRFIDEPDWVTAWQMIYVVGSGLSGQFMQLCGSAVGGDLTSGATTGYILSNKTVLPAASPTGNTLPATLMSTDAADYPLYIKVDNEIIYLPNAPAVATSQTITNTGGATAWSQQVTGMVRGQLGTTAAAHVGVNGTIGTATTLAQDQHLTVVADEASTPQFAF